MLAGQDQLLHPRLAGDAHDLAGVELARIEHRLALIAVSPFLARKGIDGEVSEPDEFHLLPLKLARTGHRPVRRGRRHAREGPARRRKHYAAQPQNSSTIHDLPSFLHRRNGWEARTLSRKKREHPSHRDYVFAEPI